MSEVAQNPQSVVIEEGVTLPKAVRDAAARSEALVRQNVAPPPPVASEPQAQPTPEPSAAQTPPDAPIAPAPPAPAPQVTPAGNARPEGAGEDWKRKYDSVRGHLDNANKDKRALADRVRELEGILAAMQFAPPSAPASRDPQPTQARLVTDQEVQEYGDDFLAVVGKKAKDEIFPELQQLRTEIGQLQTRVNGVGQHIVMNARDQLFARLEQDVPNWRELNTNQEFLSWLDLPDPYSGAIRKQLLDAAFQRNDATRVAAFFNGFIADEAVTRSADPPPNLAPRVPLANLAAPGRAKTVATEDVPTEKPTITRAQVSQFYADVTAGRYRGNDAEKNRIEAIIIAAGREGRVL